VKRHPETISLRLDDDLRDANGKIRPPGGEQDGGLDIYRLLLERRRGSARGHCGLLALD